MSAGRAWFRRIPPDWRRDAVAVAVFGLLGVIFSYIRIPIPHTSVFIDIRWVFGLMGVALVRRNTSAAVITLAISATVGGRVPFLTGLLGNLAYSVPFVVSVRLLHPIMLRRLRHPAAYAAGWLGVVTIGYQVFHTPIIWLVLSHLKGAFRWTAAVEGWATQPYLEESIFSAVLCALGMTALRMYEDLRRSEARLATTFDSIGDAVVVTDTAGRVTRMNPVAERLTGWRLDEAAGRPLTEVFRIENARTGEPAESPVDHVLREGTVVGLANHTRLLARDGSVYQIADSAAPIRDAEGGVTGVVMVFRDVTEDYDRREALRMSEERLRLLTDATRVGLLIHREGKLLEANPRFYRMLGLEPGAFDENGLNVLEAVVAPGELDAVRERIAKGETDYETTGVRRDGSTFPAQVHVESIEYEGAPARAAAIIDITDLRRTEEQVRLQAMVLDQIADLVTITDLEGRILYVNEANRRALGHAQAELVGKRIDALGEDPQAGATQRQILESTLRDGEWTGEVVNRTADGAAVTLLCRTQIVHNQRGEAVALCGVSTDITASKRADQRLRASEARYRAFFEGSRDGLVIIDEAGRFVDCNEAYERMLGYTLDELKAMDDFYRVTPERWIEWERTEIVEKQLMARGHSDTYEKEYIRKDGTVFPVELTAYRMAPGPGGDVLYWGVARDLTERKRSLEALRESEERWQFALEGAGAGVWDWRPGANVVYYSPQWKAVLGYGRDELEDTFATWEALVHPDDHAPVMAALQRCLAGEAPAFRAEHRLRAKGGDYRWVISRGKVMQRAADGAPLRVIGTQIDIDDRKRIEERLQQSEKLEAIGQLAGGVAHDFNNQLGGIMGYAELLQRRADDESVRAYAEKIILAAERAGELTGQLLAFARKGRYAFGPVDLHRILGDVVSMLEHTIDRRIRVEQVLQARRAVVNGDATQLQNALLNLGLNARDALPEGGCISFRTSEVVLDAQDAAGVSDELSPGRYVELRISDDGVGMPPEVRRRIFEPFFTTKPEGQGTGMGLAAVYGTVQAHKGAISVYSEPGCGTTFVLRLPHLAEDEAADAPGEVRDEAPPSHGRVLLVDDEENIRSVIEAILRSAGYEVTACADGSETVQRVREAPGRFDLLVLDMVMPGMSGAEVFRAVREIDPDLRILLVSGYSLDGGAGDLVEGGDVEFVQKPFRSGELLRAVARAREA